MKRTVTFEAFSGGIPDYQSNATNWVGGYFIEGNLRITMAFQEGEVVLHFYVPAQFSGGVGMIERHREVFQLGVKTLVSKMAGRPLIVRFDQGVETLLVYCFGRHYVFEVVSSL